MDNNELVIKKDELARTIDLSAVRPGTTKKNVIDLISFAKKIGCIAVFTFPSFTKLVVDLLSDSPRIHIGGIVGFPSGATTTKSKVYETGQLIDMGCNEIDMVINFGMLRSGLWAKVQQDIQEVIAAAEGLPVKVILECHYLTDDEIKHACEISMKAGVSFIKTGTGWAPTGATLRNVALIKSYVGDSVGIKAAGGVRDLDTLFELYRRGARRFGIGIMAAKSIFEEVAKFSRSDIHLPAYKKLIWE